jgi:hypothetical protein
VDPLRRKDLGQRRGPAVFDSAQFPEPEQQVPIAALPALVTPASSCLVHRVSRLLQDFLLGGDLKAAPDRLMEC